MTTDHLPGDLPIDRAALTAKLAEHVDPDVYAYTVCNCGTVHHSAKLYLEHLADALEPLLAAVWYEGREARPGQANPFRTVTEMPVIDVPADHKFERSDPERLEELHSFLSSYGRLPE